MSSFNKKMLVTVIAMSTASMGAYAEEPKTMFRNSPSITNTELKSISEKNIGSIAEKVTGSVSDGSAMQVKKLSDGRVVVSGKLHGGRGVDMEVIIPQITPEVHFNGPGGVDENGNPITLRERKKREVANKIVFEGLKAQGYEYEKYKKSREGVKTQLDLWNDLTEETRKHIAEHGPINSKDFVLPGSTPELSAKLSDPDVGVRMENGQRVYYLHGERLNLYPEKTDDNKPKATPVTSTTTKVSKSQRKLTKEEKAKYAAKLKAHKGDPFAAMEKPAVDALPKQAPTRAYVPEPEEDLRRKPTDFIQETEDQVDVRDVRQRIEDMFPDMGKLGPVSMNQSVQEGSHLFRSQNPRISITEKIVSVALGISPVYASEPNSESDVDVAKSLRAGEKFKDLVNEIGLDTNSTLSNGDYADVLKEIRGYHDKIVESVVGKPDSKSEEEEESGEEEGLPSYIERVKIDGQYYDPAQFAADVVNRATKSLTPDQFDEDVQAIVSSLSESRVKGGADVLTVLGDILEANPEIFEAIPDADKRLQRLRGDVYDIAPPNPKGEQTFIFVSYSLSEEVLKEIIQRNGERSDVTLVMRGVPKGMRIDNGMKKMQEIANSVTPSVPLILDPPLFDVYGITHVPTVVRAGRTPSKSLMNPNDPKGRRYAPMVAKVEGLHNDQWLLEQIEAGERGDLGQQGNVKEITEPNLIDEMKRRVALIDWDKKKKEAVKRFWKKQTFKVYPTASEQRIREFDPSILVERDFNDLAGRPIRRAGDIVNPLQIRPFTQTVLIFNPLSEDEMERVEAFRKAFKEAGKLNLVLIATQMDKEASWDGYKALTDKLDAHVFMMTPEIEYQWHIEKTPAVVTADNNRHVFLVEELGPVVSDKEAGK